MVRPPETTRALLSVQRALLGALTPNLYGACISAEHDLVEITWYVSPELSEEEWDDLSAAGAEVIADFPAPFMIDEKFVTVDRPDVTLPTVGYWAILQSGFRVTDPDRSH